MRIIFLIVSLSLFSNLLYSKPLSHREFSLGDNKRNILTLLGKQKYSQHQIYYDSNDRFIGEIKVKPENSIKIVIKSYMEKEEVFLVFDSSDILFDIYIKKTPMDIRDYIDYRVGLIESYGKPDEQQFINEKHIIVWRLNKKRNAVYLIYNSDDESIVINIRDLHLKMKYEPVN